MPKVKNENRVRNKNMQPTDRNINCGGKKNEIHK